LSDSEHTTFLSKIEEVLAMKIQKKRNRLSRKLSMLRATSPKNPNLTVAEVVLLNKGLNYVRPPSRLPIDDIIVRCRGVWPLWPTKGKRL
jgi:hypothetical protein